MNKLRNISIMASILIFITTIPVFAQPPCETLGHRKVAASDSGEMGHMMKRKQGHPMGHGKEHSFSTTWKKTLTADQKQQIDKMHLELKKSVNTLKAQLNMKKTELNNMSVNDNPDKKAIYQKIDDILELKREVMRKKYDHKVKMRSTLTPEQRVSFDMKLLSGDKHKKSHN